MGILYLGVLVWPAGALFGDSFAESGVVLMLTGMLSLLLKASLFLIAIQERA